MLEVRARLLSGACVFDPEPCLPAVARLRDLVDEHAEDGVPEPAASLVFRRTAPHAVFDLVQDFRNIPDQRAEVVALDLGDLRILHRLREREDEGEEEDVSV